MASILGTSPQLMNIHEHITYLLEVVAVGNQWGAGPRMPVLVAVGGS